VTAPVAALVERFTGRKVTQVRALSGGCVGQVYLAEFSNGGRVVAKIGPGLETEGWMLTRLASTSHLPVPHVVHCDDSLLLMDYVAGGDPLDAPSQRHAAELLADLHSNTWHAFGLDRDTTIGGLRQVNTPSLKWLDFFRDQRLLAMADQAAASGHLPATLRGRVDTLAGKLDRWIEEPAQPALLHGDSWTGNILVHDGRVAAFIDPAIYYGHPEIELAFGTMFGTFDEAFFARYEELNPISPGFWQERRELYLLYPLLVHVTLFGGTYLSGVERTLDHFLG
jgi:fructosamine-3-kinase